MDVSRRSFLVAAAGLVSGLGSLDLLTTQAQGAAAGARAGAVKGGREMGVHSGKVIPGWSVTLSGPQASRC